MFLLDLLYLLWTGNPDRLDLYQFNMLTMKADKQILKNIKKYLHKEGRVSFELHELSELLRFSPLSLYSSRILDGQHSISSVFKFYLLFHRLIIENPSQSKAVLQLLTNLKYSPKENLEQMLEQKLIKPYRLYLQRRIQLNLQDEGAEEENEREVRVYQLLNLINLATSFCDVIYTFGRYYLGKFGCAIDFNIVLGVDINRLYQQMVKCVRRPANRSILDQIEAAHQKMYVVFYNCYFHKYLKSYIPKWVNTDVNTAEVRKKSMTPHKESTKSTLSREGSGKQRSLTVLKGKKLVNSRVADSQIMGDSCLFLNERVEEQVEEDPEYTETGQNNCKSQAARGNRQRKEIPEGRPAQMDEFQKERLKLLLSMERVVGRN